MPSRAARSSWGTPRAWALALAAVSLLTGLFLFGELGRLPIQDWRPADTQAIARNFTAPGSNLFYPRIDWGGDGSGIVESELQLYPWLVSLALRVTGDVEWPGRLLSLAFTLGAVGVVFAGLRREHRAEAAALGALTLLVSRGVLQVACNVQPEALCLLLFAGAWFAFLEFERTESRRALAVYAALGALAMLVKPTAAQLGVASFALVVLRSRRLLRRWELWLAWAVMVGLLGAHLLHGQRLYAEHGNTFGVLSGGDSKTPGLDHLVDPSIVFSAVRRAVTYGTGKLGSLAVLLALWVGAGRKPLLALLAANALWTLLALRYTSSAGGNHYHLLAGVTAGHAVAGLVTWLAERRPRIPAVAAGLLLLAELGVELRSLHRTKQNPFNASAIAAAEALARRARPGELVVVRSVEVGYDAPWRTANNFQDPRVVYGARVRGWAVALDDARPESVAIPARRGARFYVEVLPRSPVPALDAWLDEHATLLERTSFGGRVFALTR